MKKFSVLILVVCLLFSFSVFCFAETLATDISEVSSNENQESSSESQVQESTSSQEDETAVSDLEESSPDSSTFTSEIEALTGIYNQNVYILFGIFCCFGAMIALAFSFWKW